MEDFKIKNIFPVGIIYPFLILIALEYLLIFVLNFYNQKLTNQISSLEVSLTSKEEELFNDLNSSEAFFSFSQIFNIVEIFKNKKSVSLVINNFKKIMPNFLIVKTFEFDVENNELKIQGATRDWQSYIKLIGYLNNLTDIKVKELSSPKFENNFINFSMVLLLKPTFYQQ